MKENILKAFIVAAYQLTLNLKNRSQCLHQDVMVKTGLF